VHLFVLHLKVTKRVCTSNNQGSIKCGRVRCPILATVPPVRLRRVMHLAVRSKDYALLCTFFCTTKTNRGGACLQLFLRGSAILCPRQRSSFSAFIAFNSQICNFVTPWDLELTALRSSWLPGYH